MDHVTPEVRSKIMAAVKTSSTGPEIVVRGALHQLGFRYSLHSRDLPGRPDLVFRSRRKVIFIHGCFWHGHNCPKGRLPKTRSEYWRPKIAANKVRDRRTAAKLRRLGWSVMTVWQCKTRDLQKTVEKIAKFLESL